MRNAEREKKKANKSSQPQVATEKEKKRKRGKKASSAPRHTAESSHFPGLILGGGEAILTTGDLGVGVTVPGVSAAPLPSDLPRP